MKLTRYQQIHINKKILLILLIVILTTTSLILCYANFKREKKFDLLSGQYKTDYTLSYNTDGGSTCNNKTISYNNQFGELCAPTRNGYKLDHWEDTDGNIVTNSTVLNIPGDVLLNAVYKKDCDYENGYTWEYTYQVAGQLFTAPCEGDYAIELWGASGPISSTIYPGGYGAYTKGTINFNSNQKIYVYVGEQGKNGSLGINDTMTKGQPAGATFNGGGAGGIAGGGSYPYAAYYGGASGGGATDVRLTNGSWFYFDGLKSRIMVAGGGGGNNYDYGSDNDKGEAGGLISYKGAIYNWIMDYQSSYANDIARRGVAATQTSGYKFGIGQNGPESGTAGACHGFSGAGGGFYGGYASASTGSSCHVFGGAGGSSYISGHAGCNSINESSIATNINHNGSAIHYSGFSFNTTVMVDGAGYKWTTTKGSRTGMPTHDGTGSLMGHVGDGFAKITLIRPTFKADINASLKTENGEELLVLSSINNPEEYVLNYQWYKNNVAITGATSKDYVVTAVGNYKLKVNDFFSANYNVTSFSKTNNKINLVSQHLGNNTCIGKMSDYSYLRTYPYDSNTCNITILSNLFTNGNLEYNSNKNAPHYTYDANEKVLLATGVDYNSVLGDIAEIDDTKNYVQSITLKTSNANSGEMIGVVEYDCNKQPITASTNSFVAGSTTTLARDLNPGDTVVYLSNANGFVVSSSTPSYQLGLIFWNYKDCNGNYYPIETYSRNYNFDLYNYSAVNKSNNTITLKSPYTGIKMNAGTSVSQSSSGGTYNYGLSYRTYPITYGTYSVTYTKYGNNAKFGTNYVELRYGTKYLSTFILHNYYGTTPTTLYIKNYSLKPQ